MSDEILSMLVHHAEMAADATYDARQMAETCRDYYDGKQWTSEEESALKSRNQPVVTINRIKPKVDFLLGSEIMGRTQPKAFPRTPIHEEDADSITDALRYVADDTKFNEKRSAFAKNLIIEGIGAATVTVRPGQDKAKILVTHVPWDRFYYDPHSRAPDFSDAKYLGVVQWMDDEDAIQIGQDTEAARMIIESAYSDYNTGTSDTYEDKPHFWLDPKRKRVKVCQEYFIRSGQWYHAIYTKAGFLVPPEQSPYIDDEGNSLCCIVARSAFVDRDGNRYGAVKQLLSPQDEINKRRSKALHLMTTRTVVTERGAVDDVEKTRKELHKPDGVIEVNANMRFDIESNMDIAQAHLGFMAEAKSEIDAIGANAALTGSTEKGLSGRAVQALQQGGTVELAPIMDAVKGWQQQIYTQIWYAVRQFWTGETWVRVTDDERNLKWVGLNQPVTMADQLIEEQRQQGIEIPPELEQRLRSDPVAQQVVAKRNDLSAITVDIVLDDVPDTVVMQQEQFETLAQIAPHAANMPPQLFEALIEASQLRNKRQILDKLQGKAEGENPIPPQIQQQMAQMQQVIEASAARMQELEAQNAELSAANEQKQAENQLKAEEIKVKAYDAATKRMEVESKTAESAALAEAKAVEADAKHLTAEAQMLSAKTAVAEVMAPIVDAVTGIGQALSTVQEGMTRPKRAKATLSDGSIVLLEQE